MNATLNSFLFIAILASPITVFAQAGTDCSEQVKMAVENCNQRIENAKATNVGGYGKSGGANGAGDGQAGGAMATSQAIGQQIPLCENRDLASCKQSCDHAIASANMQSNNALAANATNNRSQCEKQINGLVKKAEASQAGLAQFADSSIETAKASGNSKYDDSVIDSEKGQANPDVQQVGCNPTVNLEVGCTITPMPFDRAKAVQRFLKEGGIKSYVSGQ